MFPRIAQFDRLPQISVRCMILHIQKADAIKRTRHLL